MKRGLLGLSLLIFLTQVISAQFYSGYGRFSLTNFFDRIDPQTIILVLLFLIFFALIFYALSRIFKGPYGQPNKGIAGVIAFAISAMIIYGLYRTGFDIGNIFYDWGFSVGSIYTILPIIILIFAILVIWGLGRTRNEFGEKTFSLRRGLGGFFMLFGLFIILLTVFTDIFYDKGIPLVIGIVLSLIGLVLSRRGRKAMRGVGRGVGWTSKKAWGGAKRLGRGAKWVASKYDWEKEKKQARAIGRDVGRVGRGVGKGLAWGGRKAKKIAQREWQKEKDVMQERGIRREEGKLQRAQKAAYKEDAKRQKAEQAQGQIQQINNEVARLEQMIPNASVIERGKIEDQIRALLKRAKKLR